MNFIDISGWQAGLSLENVFEKNANLHGVIVKATEGNYYVNPHCDGWVREARGMGKPWGFYHYLSGGGAREEADYFYRNASLYFKVGVPAADYEGDALRKGTGYLKEFLDRIYELSGVRPLVYCSLSVVQGQDFSAIARDGYKLWVAQYANMKYTGIQENPWQSGSVAPFNGYVMHQYSSCGRLSGWSGSLDLDKFWGERSDWDALVNGGSQPAKKHVNPEIVSEVLDGKYGINEERRKKLEADGYDYDEVQAKINELYVLAGNIRHYKQEAGEYWSVLANKIV